MLKFLRNRYLVPNPAQELIPPAQDTVACPFSTHSLRPDHSSRPDNRIFDSLGVDNKESILTHGSNNEPADPKSLESYAQYSAEDRAKSFRARHRTVRARAARIKWLQVLKDGVGIAVGLVTVLQFLWPIAQWVWAEILEFFV